MITPFKVNIRENVLTDLKDRLANTRWPDEISDSGWNYGTNRSYLKELASYWQHTFDWRKTEAKINAYPNFFAEINGYKVHFIHVKGKGKRSIPLIITHGWPGSFLEMYQMIPLLTDNNDLSFDLVIPSVIGFGFSDKATRPGCDSSFVAELWHQLMLQLGYSRYGAQGGDIGAGVSTWLALKHPESLLGLHLNYIPSSYQPYLQPGEPLSEEVKKFQQFASTWEAKEGAYASVHSTKPITLAYGLNDSPVGLCAWILEKFNSWSDHQRNIENSFTKDELLANITLYWITQSIHSSMRIYLENSKNPLVFREKDFVKGPVGFAQFPKELPTPPRSYIEKGYNIRQWTSMPSGGHFAAAEEPQLLANDIISFFSSIL